MVIARVRRLPSLLLVACLGPPGTVRAALPTVPVGLEFRLLATVPALEHSCQVATTADGSLFVAEDPMESEQGDVSIIPNGLAEGLSQQGLADPIGDLETLKEAPAKPAAGGDSRP